MSAPDSAAAVLQRLLTTLDAQQWDRLPDLLAPGFRCAYSHTGELLDAEQFVALNRDYPGSWRLVCEEVVVDGERAVARTRVSNDAETYFVASFATVSDGRLTGLTEVWTPPVPTPPERNLR